jgi:uncharacterized membrane protein
MEVLHAPSPAFPASRPLSDTSRRVVSIDLLRGVIMIIMALDHVRDYYHADALLYDPTDLTRTSVLLFFTRWITHFCAPVFVFLAGTSAFLVGQRKTKKQLSLFLLTRGLWLMFLELTVVNFAWFFNFHFPSFFLVVIWTLGLSMVVLSALIHLPLKIILVTGILIVAGHNLLDNIHVPGTDIKAFLWAELHEPQRFTIAGHLVGTGYPVLAWIGVMALGYCFGSLYDRNIDPAKRKLWLVMLGVSMIIAFMVLRFYNFYGDPHPWSQQTSFTFTLLSFLNVTKYPPSLLYVLVTLGPAMLFLAFTERPKTWISGAILHIGRVPMFYYLLHLYLIHLGAMAAAEISGIGWQNMILSKWPWLEPQLKGYGFSLGVVYLVWISVVLLLYPLCKWYDRYKQAHREKWWLSYL